MDLPKICMEVKRDSSPWGNLKLNNLSISYLGDPESVC